jgi:methionyl aminopeptidase
VALFRGVKSPFARRPFPGVICASVNNELVHGIPSDKVKLKEGDIISVDYGVKLNGYCSDAAFTKAVGSVDEQTLKLMDVTKGMLEKALEMARPGIKWSEIAGEMEAMAIYAGFSVVKDFVGHGIGTEMHEDPKVPNFVSRDLKRNDILLKEGMMLAIEPMVNAGSSKVKTLNDGWTVVTADGSNCAHYEHTIAVVKGGCRVMTG